LFPVLWKFLVIVAKVALGKENNITIAALFKPDIE